MWCIFYCRPDNPEMAGAPNVGAFNVTEQVMKNFRREAGTLNVLKAFALEPISIAFYGPYVTFFHVDPDPSAEGSDEEEVVTRIVDVIDDASFLLSETLPDFLNGYEHRQYDSWVKYHRNLYTKKVEFVIQGVDDDCVDNRFDSGSLTVESLQIQDEEQTVEWHLKQIWNDLAGSAA